MTLTRRPKESPEPDPVVEPDLVVEHDPVVMASWIFGLALALVTEEAAEDVALDDLITQAEGSFRALEGAYGRGVVLLSEYPDDAELAKTVALLSKALRRAQSLS